MDDMVGEMSAGKGWMCTAWLDTLLGWCGWLWWSLCCFVSVRKIERLVDEGFLAGEGRYLRAEFKTQAAAGRTGPPYPLRNN